MEEKEEKRRAAFIGTGAALLMLSLGGCALIDAGQARLCRTALPALEPAGTQVEVLRTAGGPEARSLRIDYRATREGRSASRWAVCRFGPGRAAELVGIATDRGPVSGARLYILNRYYLDTPEGVAGDPGPGDPGAGLAEWPPGLAYGAQQALAGLPGAAIYGLLAAAYALVFGLVGRVNLAFGEIAAVGGIAIGVAFAALTDGAGLRLGALVAALLVAIAAAALHAAVAGYATFAAVPASRGQASLVATLGASLALMEYLRLAGGPLPAWIPPMAGDLIPVAKSGSFVVTANPVSLATASVGALAALGLAALMRYSGFGRAWRAQSDDSLAAALFGIDGRALLLRTLCLGGGLAGLAGGLAAVQFGALGFAGGFQLGLKALAASILGGIGSVGGALLGGLAIGAFETIWSATMPIDGRDVALDVVLVLTIVLRPRGLFGSALEPARER